MNCAIKLKGYEVAGSTFQDRKFIFTNRDISGDVFTAVVYNSFSKKNEIEGLKVGNEVFFPYSTLENLKTGRYRIEFWATMAGIGNEMIALEEFFVSSDPSCTNGSNETNVSITFKEEVINFTIQTALMYKGSFKWGEIEDKPVEFPPSAHTHQWDKIEDKPTVFYDDTGIKEEIAEKVDKVAGFGLSKNNFSDAEKTKLENLQNFDPSGIIQDLGNKVDKIAGKGLSTNDYTTDEKNKLAGLDGNKFFGKFADETALSALVGVIGAYAYVGGVGRNDESYIWDDDDLKWVKSNNIPTAETPASVKTKYESNPDTNAFTNAYKTKLDNINLSNYVLQTSLNSQLTSYVLQSNLNTQLQSYATLNGVQTFNGTKTFTEAPIVPTPTLGTHAVNKNYVDSNFIPNSQKNQPNGVATLDNTTKIPSSQIPDMLVNKILMMTGEFNDSFISGFRDRNLLIDAYYNASQFDIDIVGNGSMRLGLESTKKILTNSESNFVPFDNVDSSSQVVITIVYPTLFNNFSDGRTWQCIIENRLINHNSFQDIKVETIGTEGVWNECYNVQNVQNIRDTGMYSFPVGQYNFFKNYPQFPFGIKGIRVTLSNPNSNIVYLSNIIFRHLSNTLAPQFPHIGRDNKFYETNEFKKPLIIPNGISSNHAITLAQLNGYVSISALNVQLDNYVTKNGSLTINGTKTFTESPVVPNPTLNTHAVNKNYVDNNFNIKNAKYYNNTNINDNTFTSAWVTIANVQDNSNTPVLFAVRTYAHSSVLFSVIKSYSTAGNITVLNYNGISNDSFRTVKGVRLLGDGSVQIRLVGNTNGNIQLTVNTFGSSDNVPLVSSLVVYAGTPSIINEFDNLETGKFVTSTGYKVNGGLSTGFLKADGSVDRTVYAQQGGQLKLSSNVTISEIHNRYSIIVTANRTVTVPTGLSDDFECTFIADGGTITFANSGTTFKLNNSKVTLLSGGIATLRKENGTNNFYLKGDLT